MWSVLFFSLSLKDLEGPQPEGRERADSGPGWEQRLWEEHSSPAGTEAVWPWRGEGKWEEPRSSEWEAGYQIALRKFFLVTYLHVNPILVKKKKGYGIAMHLDKTFKPLGYFEKT